MNTNLRSDSVKSIFREISSTSNQRISLFSVRVRATVKVIEH